MAMDGDTFKGQIKPDIETAFYNILNDDVKNMKPEDMGAHKKALLDALIDQLATSIAKKVVDYLKSNAEVMSTSDTNADMAFWSWMTQFAAAWSAWIPIPGPTTDGGASLKLLMTPIMSAAPTKMVSKGNPSVIPTTGGVS